MTDLGARDEEASMMQFEALISMDLGVTELFIPNFVDNMS
jgi:hypothetical protein